jgi:hypothetical protein
MQAMIGLQHMACSHVAQAAQPARACAVELSVHALPALPLLPLALPLLGVPLVLPASLLPLALPLAPPLALPLAPPLALPLAPPLALPLAPPLALPLAPLAVSLLLPLPPATLPLPSSWDDDPSLLPSGQVTMPDESSESVGASLPASSPAAANAMSRIFATISQSAMSPARSAYMTRDMPDALTCGPSPLRVYGAHRKR